MNSKFVNVTQTTAIIALAKYLTSVLGEDTAEKFAESADTYDKVFSLLEEKSDLIFALDSILVDGIFSVAFGALSELSEASVVPVTRVLASVLSKSSDANVLTRVNLLRYLFNSLESSSPLKFDLYNSLLSLVISGNIPKVLAGQFQDLAKWLVAWKASPAQVSEIYGKVGTIQSMVGELSSAQEYFVKSLQASGAAVTPATSAVAQQAALYAVNQKSAAVVLSNTASYAFLLSFPAVKALSGDAAVLVKALEVLLSGSVADAKKLVADNAAVLDKLQVDEDLFVNNVKALCIADVVTPAATVPFSEIAKALGSDEQVEEAIVEAIFNGQITGKINQNDKTVRVDKVKPRTFNADSWKQLKDRANQWKATTANVLSANKV